MTGSEFKDIIEAWGSQNGFARWVGVEDRTVRRWIAVEPPHGIAILVRLMRLLRLSPETVSDMLDEPTPRQ